MRFLGDAFLVVLFGVLLVVFFTLVAGHAFAQARNLCQPAAEVEQAVVAAGFDPQIMLVSDDGKSAYQVYAGRGKGWAVVLVSADGCGRVLDRGDHWLPPPARYD